VPVGIASLVIGHTTIDERNAERQLAGSIDTDFLTLIITIINAKENAIINARRAPPSWPANASGPNMITMPARANTLAKTTCQRSFSPIMSHARAPLMNGPAALIAMTSATVVRRRALR